MVYCVLFCLPGGFGVAKNLCSWAVQGKDCCVNEQVKAVLLAFHAEKKPIGLCCISPVLAAKVFPGCEVTVGNDKDERYVSMCRNLNHRIKTTAEIPFVSHVFRPVCTTFTSYPVNYESSCLFFLSFYFPKNLFQIVIIFRKRMH